jgi:hypothetical protein
LTTTSAGKKYQPKVTQVNTKVMVEELTLEENFKQTPSTEASTSKPNVNYKNPEVIAPKIKIEIDPSNTPNNLNKRASSIPIVIIFLSTPSSP